MDEWNYHQRIAIIFSLKNGLGGWGELVRSKKEGIPVLPPHALNG